jgi:hypothetical protein
MTPRPAGRWEQLGARTVPEQYHSGDRINQIARNILQHYPLPNTATAARAGVAEQPLSADHIAQDVFP